MHFQMIELRNVKCFREAVLNFSVPGDSHEGVNFIIGENMSGKSTIINGIIWSLLGDYAQHINTTPDLRVDSDYIFSSQSNNLPRSMRVVGTVYGKPFGSAFEYLSNAPNSVKNLYRLLSDKDFFFKLDEKSLPFLVYYPPSSHTGFQIDPAVLEDYASAWRNFNPYAGVLGVPNFKETVALLTNQYAYFGFGPTKGAADVAREKLIPLLGALTDLLDADFLNLTFAINSGDGQQSMILLPKIFDLNLPPETLSTGFLSTFAFLVDFYMRMLRLPLGTNSEACCIVDEITAFMHPSLQMKIVPALKKIFPNTQFIFTTHSPYGLMSDLRAKVFSIERNRNLSEVNDVTNIERSTLAKSALIFDADILAPSVVRVRNEFDKIYLISKDRLLSPIEKERMNQLIRILASSDQRFAILSNYDGELLQGWDLLSSLEEFNETD